MPENKISSLESKRSNDSNQCTSSIGLHPRRILAARHRGRMDDLDPQDGEFRSRAWNDPVEDLDEAVEIFADLGLDEDASDASKLAGRARRWSDRAAFDALSRIACALGDNLDL